MSGFEIVGVVLGTLPLVFAAAQTYRQGFEPLENWYRFRTDFVDFINKVDCQKQKFDNITRRLLESVNLPEEYVQGLMTNPEDERWKSEDIRKRMESKLGTSYSLYMSIMETVNGLMVTLQRRLSLKDGEVCPNFFYSLFSSYCSLLIIFPDRLGKVRG